MAVLPACYGPSHRDCAVRCAAAADCAPSHVCGSDGWCASASIAGNCGPIAGDASIPPIDGMTDGMPDGTTDLPPDAAIVCTAATCGAAGGVCNAGVCEIDRDNPGSVTCPAGLPCKVICNTGDACKNGVSCGTATSCVVECIGDAACQDKGVDCGAAGTCSVVCRGSSACQHGSSGNRSVECRTAACTVTCDGSGACQDGIGVDPGGVCTSHCCQSSACQGGTETCTNDNVCT